MNHGYYDPNYIRDILRSVKTIAMVGASNSEIRPSHLVMKYLLDKGYDVIPVNPTQVGAIILGKQVFGRLTDIPFPIDMVDIFRSSSAAGEITEEALKLRPPPKVIWMQLTVFNEEAAHKAEAQGIKVVMNRCPKMEYGKLCGEWNWVGGNSGMISSRRQTLHASGRIQSLGIADRK